MADDRPAFRLDSDPVEVHGSQQLLEPLVVLQPRAEQAACVIMATGAEVHAAELHDAIQLDFALATRTVFYAMAAVLVVAFIVALVGMPGGKAADALEAGAE